MDSPPGRHGRVLSEQYGYLHKGEQVYWQSSRRLLSVKFNPSLASERVSEIVALVTSARPLRWDDGWVVLRVEDSFRASELLQEHVDALRYLGPVFERHNSYYATLPKLEVGATDSDCVANLLAGLNAVPANDHGSGGELVYELDAGDFAELLSLLEEFQECEQVDDVRPFYRVYAIVD